MSFNHACPDVPAPVIAESAVLLGPGIKELAACKQLRKLDLAEEVIAMTSLTAASHRFPADDGSQGEGRGHDQQCGRPQERERVEREREGDACSHDQ